MCMWISCSCHHVIEKIQSFLIIFYVFFFQGKKASFPLNVCVFDHQKSNMDGHDGLFSQLCETRAPEKNTDMVASIFIDPAACLFGKIWQHTIPGSLPLSVVKSIQILYLSKSINTALQKPSATSKSLELKMYLSKSMKVLASKCT